MKTCTKCGEVKPRSEFHKNKKSGDGLQFHCKLCRAKWRKANKEKVAEAEAAWRKANPERSAASKAKWRKANKEKMAAWRKANPDKHAANAAKHRAAKLQATPHWLTQQHLDQIEAVYRLAALMKRLGLGEYHVDHIVPLQGAEVRGLHVPWNLQVLPASQNIAKHNKLAA